MRNTIIGDNRDPFTGSLFITDAIYRAILAHVPFDKVKCVLGKEKWMFFASVELGRSIG